MKFKCEITPFLLGKTPDEFKIEDIIESNFNDFEFSNYLSLRTHFHQVFSKIEAILKTYFLNDKHKLSFYCSLRVSSKKQQLYFRVEFNVRFYTKKGKNTFKGIKKEYRFSTSNLEDKDLKNKNIINEIKSVLYQIVQYYYERSFYIQQKFNKK